MALRQVVAASLAVLLAVGSAPLLAQQGAISGKATDEAKTPYSNFSVRIVVPDTGEIVSTQVLGTDGQFSITGLTLGHDYLVQLVDTTDNDNVVCQEGPYGLSEQVTSHSGINIDCGGPPAALWLIAGAAGLVTAVGLLTQSNPQ